MSASAFAGCASLATPSCSLVATTSINRSSSMTLPGSLAASHPLLARARSTSSVVGRAPRQQFSVQAGRVVTREAWWQKQGPDNFKSVHSVEELLHEMAISRDRLVVLDFYAQWCGSCKALYPKLSKLSEENPDILVLKVNFDDNKTMCKALDVKVLPYFQFYRGSEGRVDAFPASVSRVQRLRDAIAEHSTARCSLGNESPGLEVLNSLIATQHQAAEERHASSIVPAPGLQRDTVSEAGQALAVQQHEAASV